MEDNTKQQQLLFDKGITNAPSDFICSDNTLEDSVGMIYENGEHRVIQNPVTYTEIAYTEADDTLLLIHYTGETEQMIIRKTVGTTTGGDPIYTVIWRTKEDSVNLHTIVAGLTKFVNVTAIGNTLIFSSGEGLTYALWKGSEYKVLGNKIPDIRVQFSLGALEIVANENIKYYTMAEMLDGYLAFDNAEVVQVDNNTYTNTGVKIAGLEFRSEQYESAKTVLSGMAASRLHYVKEQKKFAFPFWARSAVRLYDGSTTNVSAPFLLLPTVLNNWNIFCSDENGVPRVMNEDAGNAKEINYIPYAAPLRYRVLLPDGFDASEWEDIISGVDIFLSEEVKNFDMEGDWKIHNVDDPETITGDKILVDNMSPMWFDLLNIPEVIFDGDHQNTWRTYIEPSKLSQEDIIKALIDKSVFYKIIELDYDDLSVTSVVDATDKIQRNAIINLTTLPQLEADDFFSRSDMIPTITKAYNKRLHLAGVHRSFFDGFSEFSFTASTSSLEDILFYVYIRTDEGDRIVMSTAYSKELHDVWFFYPDPRAYKVEVYTGTTLLYSMSLKEHPRLHGAYAFNRLPTEEEYRPAGTSSTLPTVNNNLEYLSDTVIVSEAANPFIFPAKGYVSVGMGKIKGLATQTVALGQEEHGIHPMIVFSERGISTLRINNEGEYIRADVLSREVCNNPDSIIETDGAVYFSSDKGLMIIVGNQVKCMSEQMGGKEYNFDVEPQMGAFRDFLKDCTIAYDYRDSLLWIFKKSGLNACYVYSMRHSTFGRYLFPSPITNVVNNYPDFLLQSSSTIYSLTGRADINHDTASYSTRMITRPLKLENSLAMKSIMDIKNIYDLHGSVVLTVMGSNNMRDWITLPSLKGKPWMYYRFKFVFTGIKAVDRFSGSVVVTQERHTGKLRIFHKADQ